MRIFFAPDTASVMFTSTEAFVSNDSDKLQQAAFLNSALVSSSTWSVFILEIPCDLLRYSIITSGSVFSESNVISSAIKRSALSTGMESDMNPIAEITSVSGKVLGNTISKVPSSLVRTPVLAFSNRTLAKEIGFFVVDSNP